MFVATNYYMGAENRVPFIFLLFSSDVLSLFQKKSKHNKYFYVTKNILCFHFSTVYSKTKHFVKENVKKKQKN